ncbi:MAG: lipid-A-disaccharide synthase [Bacteroidia bacterium]|nr:lipid-A-disaccharide synthase [Bacteroidia bacterium]
MKSPRLYWVVGELSGEQHAASVISVLRAREPTLLMRGMGGTDMAQLGVSLLTSWEQYAVVGFVEVLKHIGRFVSLYRKLQRDILAWKPHRVVLVDYPGLNLRLARWLVRQGIPVTYFIPPQLWAWNPGRVRYLRHPLIQVLCILPFEPDFYRSRGVHAEYVGNPLVDKLRGIPAFSASKPYIALLPGSRIHEVRHILPLMARLPDLLPKWDFYVSRVPHLPESFYRKLAPHLPVLVGQTYPLLKGAAAAVVTSGTATLEAALLGCPSVIVYKGNVLSYWIAKQLVRVPFIGLPNLILGEAVFPELIQRQCTPTSIATALESQIKERDTIQLKLANLHSLLGEKSAAEAAAQCILDALEV